MVRMMSLFLAASFVSLSGCATFSGLRQPVFFDSTPPGLKLVDSAGREIATTPSGVRIGRTRKLEFNVGIKGQTLASFNTKCSYRWLVSGVFNLPVLGQLIDLATGAAWDCPSFIKVTLPNDQLVSSESPQTHVCLRTAVIILGVSDLEEQKKVTDFWAKKMDQNCSSVLDHGVVYAALLKYGIQSQEDPATWAEDEILKFSAETGANQIYVLSLKNRESQDRTAQFEAQLLSVSELLAFSQGVKARALPKPSKIRMRLSKSVDETASWLSSTLRFRNLLTLLPNSFGLALEESSVNISKEPDQAGKYEFERSPYFGFGVSLRSIDHRDQFSPWDFSFRLRPSLFGTWGRNKVTALFRPNGTSSSAKPNVIGSFQARYASFGVLYGAIFTIYTPAVIVFTSLSLGPVWTYLSFDDASGVALALGGQLKIGIGQFVYSDLYGFFEAVGNFGSSEVASVTHQGSTSVSMGMTWYFGAWAL